MCARPHSEFNVNTIKGWTYICSKHFVGGAGPTPDYPDPIPAQTHGSLGKVRKARKPPRDRQQPPPESHCTQGSETESAEDDDLPQQLVPDEDDNRQHDYPLELVTDDALVPDDNIDVFMDISIDDDDHDHNIITSDAVVQTMQSTPPEMCDASTQTDYECDNWMRRKLTQDMIMADNASVRFWTGIQTLTLLNFLFEFLLPCAQHVPLWMGKKRQQKTTTNYRKTPKKRTLAFFQEFLLVLVRIRRGLDTGEMTALFGVTQSHVTHVFITWVNIMYKCCRPLLEWPTRDTVVHNMPKSFKRNYPKTRVLIDCSEIYMQTPRSVDAQRSTYSTYKSHNTFKFLLGIAPSGQITFISHLFVGSISDRQIVKRSGFLKMIEPKDDVMADRGFTIRDLLLRRGATLNMPAFSKGKQLSTQAVGKSRKIASLRIHVERAMERIKNNKILQGIISLQLKNSLNQIMVICCVLANMEDPLVK